MHNIIHRDIKPENIMIDSEGILKLTDFGLSKRCSKNDFCDTYCGTTEYLAPEIVNERSYNYLVDNWALGVLLYEMLYGNAPFYHHKKSKLLMNIRKVNYTFPSNSHESHESHESHDHTHVKDVISNLLKKKPKDRLQIDKILEHPIFNIIEEEVSESSENDESIDDDEVDELANDIAEITTNDNVSQKNLSSED
jgi:serine/threonine protein kinase